MMTNTENRQTITVEQAAVLLGIGRASAYQLARTGKLPGIRRLGKRYLVAIRELENFINPRKENGEEIENDPIRNR
jgi:excisionase family DNA binding protein